MLVLPGAHLPRTIRGNRVPAFQWLQCKGWLLVVSPSAGTAEARSFAPDQLWCSCVQLCRTWPGCSERFGGSVAEIAMQALLQLQGCRCIPASSSDSPLWGRSQDWLQWDPVCVQNIPWEHPFTGTIFAQKTCIYQTTQLLPQACFYCLREFFFSFSLFPTAEHCFSSGALGNNYSSEKTAKITPTQHIPHDADSQNAA